MNLKLLAQLLGSVIGAGSNFISYLSLPTLPDPSLSFCGDSISAEKLLEPRGRPLLFV